MSWSPVMIISDTSTTSPRSFRQKRAELDADTLAEREEAGPRTRDCSRYRAAKSCCAKRVPLPSNFITGTVGLLRRRRLRAALQNRFPLTFC